MTCSYLESGDNFIPVQIIISVGWQPVSLRTALAHYQHRKGKNMLIIKSVLLFVLAGLCEIGADI